MTEFVVTPTDRWFQTELATCKTQWLVSSPYIGGWLSRVQQSLPKSIRKVLLTRADLRDFASGASDLDTLCALAAHGTEIIISHRLHAKVYVIDENCGLVTSANATFNGMHGNYECGVVLRESASVRQAADLIISSFGARESPQRWTVAQLESLQEPVRQIKKTLPPKIIAASVEYRLLLDVDPRKPIGSSLREHLPGWTRLALEGVQMQPQVFDLDAFVSACAPLVVEHYPNNKNVRPKLRQQLQRLRDLGLIEFLGNATYERRS